MPKGLKYPLFFLGLAIILFGGLGAARLDLPQNATIATSVVGFLVLIISIVAN